MHGQPHIRSAQVYTDLRQVTPYTLHAMFCFRSEKNSWFQVVVENKFCAVLPNICGSSVCNLPHVTVQTPRIWRWGPSYFFFLISGRLSSLTFAIMTAYSLVQWSARPPPSFKALVQLVFGFALSHLASILILKIQYISRCCLQNYVIN